VNVVISVVVVVGVVVGREVAVVILGVVDVAVVAVVVGGCGRIGGTVVAGSVEVLEVVVGMMADDVYDIGRLVLAVVCENDGEPV